MIVRGYRVYYIDPEEGINDLVELFKKTMANKLALVIHNRMLLLNSPINLKLLKKYSEQYHKEIVFINPDPVIIHKVSHFGFEIYPDLNSLELDIPFQAEAAGAEGEDKFTNQSGHTSRFSLFSRIAGFFLIILMLVMAYLYFIYPTATIRVEPVIKESRQELQILGSTEISKIDWDNNILPLHKFEFNITGSEEVKTTGVSITGETKATGVIKFINENEEDVMIPAGTVVKSEDNIKFQTVKEVIVPKLAVDYLMDLPVGMRAGQAEVEIEALNKGSDCNLSTGQIKEMANPRENVYVINPEPTRGGRDQRLSVVTEDDLERLKINIVERLRTRLITNLYQEMGGNYRIIDEAITFSEPEIEYSHQGGQIADVLKANGTMTATGYLLRNNELDRLTTNLYQARLPKNLILHSSGININSLKLAETKEGLYNIELELRAPVIPRIESTNLVKNMQGKKIDQVRELLKNRADIDQYSIEANGKSLPRFGFAINVIVTEPESYQVFEE